MQLSVEQGQLILKPAATPPRRLLEAMMITIRFSRLTACAVVTARRPAAARSPCVVEVNATVSR